ncbi:MAG: hypothetical protein ACHQ1H_07210, partial [Nitrososphaerales archaeon]
QNNHSTPNILRGYQPNPPSFDSLCIRGAVPQLAPPSPATTAQTLCHAIMMVFLAIEPIGRRRAPSSPG